MNTVRIISGKWGGRKISTPGEGTHPMGERERNALFNMISEYLPGNLVLDAFAGSGALGIEALSRGAKAVTFVEKAPRACRVITQNLAELGAGSDTAEVLRGDAYKLLEATPKYGVVLVDPPYDTYDGVKIGGLAQMVDKDGVLVLSHPGEAPEMPGSSVPPEYSSI